MPVFELSNQLIFPNPEYATSKGLLAIGGDLSLERLLLAYRSGIFPWYNEGEPILWWAPPERMIIYPDKIHISRSMKKLIRKDEFKVTYDNCFEDVMFQCRKLRENAGTWITNEMIKAYVNLHKNGFAHSVEVWHNGELSGGLYGVSVGNAFFGESMFSIVENASKVALIDLSENLSKKGFSFIDCQLSTEHLQNMGGETVTRKKFMSLLQNALQSETIRGEWKQINFKIK